jgi:hypothetical protein
MRGWKNALTAAILPIRNRNRFVDGDNTADCLRYLIATKAVLK